MDDMKKFDRPSLSVDYIKVECECGKPHMRLASREPAWLVDTLIASWSDAGIHALPPAPK